MQALLFSILAATLTLTACSTSSDLYVPDLQDNPQQYNGTNITVNGAYLGQPGVSVLALGVSTLDNGLQAQPLGDPIWLENFPEPDLRDQLHQPGDASVYGFVKVTGRFEHGGGFGPEQRYTSRIAVTQVEPLERVRRTEVRVPNEPLAGDGVMLRTLLDSPNDYNERSVTTRGYYFWNGQIYVLAEGISTEEDGSSPQPVGRQIWMEGFPPDLSSQLNLGPNNSYVWGYVEVTGQFKSGGTFGRDGAYTSFLQVDPSGTSVVSK